MSTTTHIILERLRRPDMRRHLMKRPELEQLATWLTRSRFPETVTAIVCVGLSVVGVTLILSPEQYAARGTFAVALGPDGWAQPQLWGALIIGPCVATLASLAAHRHDVFWPLLAVLVWLTCWSLAAALSAPQGGAVISATIVYTMLSCLVASLALLYAKEGQSR